MKTTKPRLWTEKKAWLYLAGRWDRAARFEGVVRAPIGDRFAGIRRCAGLCTSISAMVIKNVPAFIIDDMRLKLEPVSFRIGSAFCWPCTIAGARQRAEFCRKQAKECSR